jgi:hypothetical protein
MYKIDTKLPTLKKSWGELEYLLRARRFFADLFLSGFLRANSAFFKAINASGSINQLLFASKKRMASRTNFHVKLLYGGASSKSVATGANNLGFRIVVGVSVFFHKIMVAGLDKTVNMDYTKLLLYYSNK